MLEEADMGVMLWLLRKAIWGESPADKAGLAPSPGTEQGLGSAAPETEGELPWGARLLLVLLLKKEPRLPRLFRLCIPADAPGLCTAPDDGVRVHSGADKRSRAKLGNSDPTLMPPAS